MATDEITLVARRGEELYLLRQGDNGIVVDVENLERFEPFPIDAILARGYWEEYPHDEQIVAGLMLVPVEGEGPTGERAFDPDQPRDDRGRWSSEGGSSGDQGSSVVTDEQLAGETPGTKLRDRMVGDWKAAREALKNEDGSYGEWNKKYAERLKESKHLDKLVQKINRMQGQTNAISNKYHEAAVALADLETAANKARNEGRTEDAARFEQEMIEKAPEVDRLFSAYQKNLNSKMDRMVQAVREGIQNKLKDDLEVSARVSLKENVVILPDDNGMESESEYDARAERWKANNMAAIEQAESLLRGCVTERIAPTATAGTLLSPADKNFHGGNRAYCRSIAGASVIHLPEGGTDYRTVIHEYGHALETDPRVNAAAQAFLWHRVGDEYPFTMTGRYPDSGFDEWELGRDDKFKNAFEDRKASYVGKFYGPDASEIMAMGMEKLFYNPREFATQDPEYFKFVVGVLDGSLL